MAEAKLKEAEIEWDGRQYSFSPAPTAPAADAYIVNLSERRKAAEVNLEDCKTKWGEAVNRAEAAEAKCAELTKKIAEQSLISAAETMPPVQP
jgi:hypothetical protein